MVGVASYGAYIPRHRLPLAAIGGPAAREGGPEKAVAWNDEDSVTMGVAAALDCLQGFDRASVDGVLFASTTYALREKYWDMGITQFIPLEEIATSIQY